MPDISESLTQRLTRKGPKRILALDGGGIRGIVTLGYLAKIESILADRFALVIPKDKFRLYHYFDLIGGTSTGAIIAALLAVGGYSVKEIEKMYMDLGRDIFNDLNGFEILGKQVYAKGKYSSKPLKDKLAQFFPDQVLGDNSNKTGLCVVTKRMDTASTWPITNNPAGKYFSVNRFKVKDIVRASTAAPTFFDPEIIDIGKDQNGVFVDGGLSIMNNPSLQLFLVATLNGFKLNWSVGEDKMFIVSIGTGRRSKKLEGKKWNNPNLLNIAQMAPEQLMGDAKEVVEIMMHLLGHGTGDLRKIDSEIENLANDGAAEKSFSYVRYDVEIVKDALKDIGITDLDDKTIDDLIEMDHAKNLENLNRIGKAGAAVQVNTTHFPNAFDLTSADVVS